MKFELEQSELNAIAEYILEKIRPSLIMREEKSANKIMNTEELAEYLNVDKTWVYKQVQFKCIPHFHAGKYPRFRRIEIDSWIQRQSTPCTAMPYPKLATR